MKLGNPEVGPYLESTAVESPLDETLANVKGSSGAGLSVHGWRFGKNLDDLVNTERVSGAVCVERLSTATPIRLTVSIHRGQSRSVWLATSLLDGGSSAWGVSKGCVHSCEPSCSSMLTIGVVGSLTGSVSLASDWQTSLNEPALTSETSSVVEWDDNAQFCRDISIRATLFSLRWNSYSIHSGTEPTH